MRGLQFIVPEPKMEVVSPEKGVIILPKPSRYNSPSNQHHWTTEYVWCNILPRLIQLLGFRFNADDFTKVNNIIDGEDFSYHLPKLPDAYSVTLYSSAAHADYMYGDATVLRLGADHPNTISPYHNLFVGSHKTCVITNKSNANGRVLLLNCDSMAIPLVPILSHYFEQIIHLDSRDHIDTQIPNLFSWDNITDYIALFTSISWVIHGKAQRQIHPYIKSNK